MATHFAHKYLSCMRADRTFLALLLAGSSMSVWAQVPDARVPAPSQPGQSEIQDIVVTAQKKSQNLRDVPIAIVAVSGDQLKQNNILRVSDISAIVPGFTLSLAALQPITFIRGFGTTGSYSFEQAVGKFVDNVSFGRDFDGRLPLFDLERLEVLKGPQVLLYGNSATAGALNITTRKPGDHFGADGSTGYEFENNEVTTQGGVTVPLRQDVSLRVSGLYQNLRDGWVHNDLTNTDEPRVKNYAGRAILRVAPTSALSIQLKAEIDRTREQGSVSQPIAQAVSPAASFTDIRLDGHRSSDYDVAPFYTKEYQDIDAKVYQADITYRVGPGTLTSTTAYRNAHVGSAQGNASQRPIVLLAADQRYHQFSQELRYAGKVGPLDLMLGGYFERDVTHVVSVTDINLPAIGSAVPPFSRVNTYDQIAKSYSGFGQVTYHVTERLSLSAGARYSVIRKSTDQALFAAGIIPDIGFDVTRSQYEAAANPAFSGLLRTVLAATPHSFFGIQTREQHAQPQAVLQYEFAPKTMIFAKFVKGDKAGGVDFSYSGTATAASPDQARFEPEKAVSFEGGIKGLVLDRKLDYAVTAYHTTFSNLQTSVFVGPTLFVTNVGKARSQGVELELHYAPVRGLRIDTTGNVQDAKYLSYPNAVCTVGQSLQRPTGCTQDLSGARTPFNSRFTGTFGVSYEIPIAAYNVSGGWTLIYKSRYNTTTNNDPLGDQKNRMTLDAHLDLRPANGWWGLSLFGRNLSNALYKEYSVATPLVRGGFNTFVARGRQLGVRLDAKF